MSHKQTISATREQQAPAVGALQAGHTALMQVLELRQHQQARSSNGFQNLAESSGALRIN
jgi:hypothetical protein